MNDAASSGTAANNEDRVDSLRDAIADGTFGQLQELAACLVQGATNVGALASLCTTRKQVASLRKVLAALKAVDTAVEEFIGDVEADAFDKFGEPRGLVLA